MQKEDSKFLKNLATKMGSPSYMINTEQRQALHLSAVFINNFTNQLYRVAHELSDFKNINFKKLIMAGSIITLEEGSTMTASFRSKFPDEKLASFYSFLLYPRFLSWPQFFHKNCLVE